MGDPRGGSPGGAGQPGGEQRAGEQLVEPGVGAVVGAVGAAGGKHQLGDQRGHQQRAEHPQRHGASYPPGHPGEQEEQQREADVVLLLDRERPEVQERALVDVGGEVVAGGGQEVPVGVVEQGAARVADDREARHHRPQQREDQAGRDDDEDRGGQQPADPAGVEAADAQPPGLLELAEQHPGHEEAGEAEEQVDADEAARGPAQPGVEEQHQVDRHGTQPVEVGSVAADHAGHRRAGRRAGLHPRTGDVGCLTSPLTRRWRRTPCSWRSRSPSPARASAWAGSRSRRGW